MQPVIICVDDEETVIETLKDQLRFHLQGSCSIEVAGSGEEALELLDELIEEKIEIPLVISDQLMPGIKGNELLERIHSSAPQALTILLTGQASVDDVGLAVNNANLYRYIGKPWEEADLVLTVQEALKSYFQKQAIEKKNDEIRRKAETFYKFVPVPFLEILDCRKDFEAIELGLCSECNLSVLFSDIRDFTKFSEGLTPQENFNFLNSYLAQLGPLIRKNSGFIDKYIGDAIMGLFENADDALQAAIDMLKHLPQYNEGRQETGNIPIEIGIGLNSGHLMLGTIGENDRFETTVIGDVVNLASRIESLTKQYGTPLLISEFTFNCLKDADKYSTRFIGKVKIKGKDIPVRIFEIFDADKTQVFDGKAATLNTFQEAVDCYYNQDVEKARALFQECLKINSGGNVAHYLL
ncbi:adenylate/guanylate cyclase domain-containing protein [Desulfococcaceae bacterium HSG9]|nr:adenylate/guanylate cyclase domain-containing protein [Desulfococcaceae bacterium HSG9]